MAKFSRIFPQNPSIFGLWDVYLTTPSPAADEVRAQPSLDMTSGAAERSPNSAGSMGNVPRMIPQRPAAILVVLETFVGLLTSIMIQKNR